MVFNQLRVTTTAAQARLALEVVFEGVEGAEDIGKVEDAGSPMQQALRICDVVKVTYK